MKRNFFLFLLLMGLTICISACHGPYHRSYYYDYGPRIHRAPSPHHHVRKGPPPGHFKHAHPHRQVHRAPAHFRPAPPHKQMHKAPAHYGRDHRGRHEHSYYH